MADVTINATEVRPLVGSVVQRLSAGDRMRLGDEVYVAADGDVEKADASAAGTVAGIIGIVVSGAAADTDGDVANGETVGVLIHGPVYLGTDASLDETKVYYVSDNAGKLADAAGTNSRVVGNPITTTNFFWHPTATG